MKKILHLTCSITLCLLMVWGSGCKPENQEAATGNIYGVVTVKSTAEPMRATGVELYIRHARSSLWKLLNKTVTYDDGHFEFDNLPIVFEELPDGSTFNGSNKIYYEYKIEVEATGYKRVSKTVEILSGQTSRIDIQMVEVEEAY